jgi:hypothetical protein
LVEQCADLRIVLHGGFDMRSWFLLVFFVAGVIFCVCIK